MALRFRGFLKDARGTTFEGIALSVSILAVAFVASADMLDYATKTQGGDLPAAHGLAAPATVANRDLDMTPTATLPQLRTRSVLDPCTGHIK